MSVIIYKTNIKKIELICIAVSTVGILLISDLNETQSLYGVFLALLSGVTYAIYSLYLEKSGLKDIETFKLCFYIALISSLLTFIYIYLKGDFIVFNTLEGWVYSAIFSILVAVLAVSFYQTGVRYIGAQKTSILSTFEPMTSIVIGAIFLNEVLNSNKVLGVIFILISAVVLVLSSGNKE